MNLSGPDWEYMRHDFMCAGEAALGVLIALGICTEAPGESPRGDGCELFRNRRREITCKNYRSLVHLMYKQWRLQ